MLTTLPNALPEGEGVNAVRAKLLSIKYGMVLTWYPLTNTLYILNGQR
jgi:hypothetical protein